jgi:hypothetical protein
MPQQLTPQQQIIADLQQNEPDKYYAVKFNGGLSQYGDLEMRRRQSQSEIDRVKTDMAPNSPFLNNLWQQARQQTVQQQAQLNTGMPMRADDFNKNWRDNYQRMLDPTKEQNGQIWKANSQRINDYENKLAEISTDKRPLISDEDIKELQGAKDGMNKVDIMTNRYQNLVKQNPQLGNELTGPAAAQLQYLANDPQVRSYIQTLPTMQSYYAKHVGSDPSRFTQQELDMIKGALPSVGDSAATVAQKAMDLKQQIASSYISSLAGLQQGMRRTGDFQPMDPNNTATYAPTPRSDTGYQNPSNSFSPGTNPPPDSTQNPTAGQPQASAQPSATPALPDYAQKSMDFMNNFLAGNAKAQQQQQASAQVQQQRAAQSQAQQAQQAGAQNAVANNNGD